MPRKSAPSPFTPLPPFDFDAAYPALVRKALSDNFPAMCANPSSEWAFYWRKAVAGEDCAPPMLALDTPGEGWEPMQGIGYICGQSQEMTVNAVLRIARRLPILGERPQAQTFA